MANENTTPLFPPTLKAPLDYPTGPMPGKINILFEANKKDIYRRFSPYTDRGSLIGTGQRQPYIWRYPDEKDKGFGRRLPKFLRVLEDINVSPTVSGADDVERIGEWLTSGYGIQYTAKQAILQAYQPFNETSIYNPLSPLIATIRPLSFGLLDRPTRFIDQGSILGGLLSALGLKGGIVGGTIDAVAEKALGRSLFTTIPPGSAGGGSFFGIRFGKTDAINPLPKVNQSGGKGLLRGRTALAGQTNFKLKWGVGGAAESIGSFIRSAIDPIIPNVIPRKTDAIYRADEKGYKYMATDERGLLQTFNSFGSDIPLTQMWFADVPPTVDSSKFIPIGRFNYERNSWKSYVGGKTIDGKLTGYSLSGVGQGPLSTILGGGVLGSIGSFIGKTISSVATPFISGIASMIGIPLRGPIDPNKRKYSQSVGRRSDDPYSYTNSDVLINYSDYISSDPSRYETKQDVINDDRLDTLKKVLSDINNTGVYKTSVPSNSRIISSGNPTVNGYNRILDINKYSKYKGMTRDYIAGSILPVEDGLINVPSYATLKMASTNKSDGINQLGVIEKNRSIKDPTTYKGWDEYRPYYDDLIAFFFYDVVNQKYIPFRATVTGINETGTAMWEEMKFIGRADMVYSYSGFSRNLAFQFKVVINSLTELLPTWKRINYMASAIKPSNYTKIDNLIYNKFMVPPMFMINIGDMYKFQPCIITSVTVNIPEDASWETLNNVNSFEWGYLDEMITARSPKNNYAQFPKEAEISMTCNLLEKERAIVGGAHFGHAPHTDKYIKNEYVPSDPGKPFLSTPSEFDMGLVEYQNVKDSGVRNMVNNSNPIYSPRSRFEESPQPTRQAQSDVRGQPETPEQQRLRSIKRDKLQKEMDMLRSQNQNNTSNNLEYMIGG